MNHSRHAACWVALLGMAGCRAPADDTQAPNEPTPTPTVATHVDAPATNTALGPMGPVESDDEDPPLMPEARAVSATQTACWVSRALPRYEGMGWTHYVDVGNGCDYAVRCVIATNVDPQPTYTADLDPGNTVRVRIRMGSPSQVFSPLVDCQRTG